MTGKLQEGCVCPVRLESLLNRIRRYGVDRKATTKCVSQYTVSVTDQINMLLQNVEFNTVKYCML